MLKSRLRFFRSLRFWLMLMLVLIGIIPTLIAVTLVLNSYKTRAIALRTSSVRNQCDMLSTAILTDGYLENPNQPELDSELSLVSSFYSGRLLVVDSNFKVIKDTFDLDTGKTSVSKDVVDCFTSGEGSYIYDDDNSYIEVITPIISKGNMRVSGVLVASVSTNEITQNTRYLENRGILVGVIGSLMILIAGFFISGFLVRPFTAVTNAIEDVTDGIEDEAISVPVYTETEMITDAFNRMLKRVRALDRSRSEFVSNVSHELKTPLTSMKVLADSLNGMDNVPNELYKEFMQDITKEIDRENNIITDLLTMVRLDKSAVTMSFEMADIGSLLEDIIRRVRPIADKKSIEIIFDSYKPVQAEVDVTKLTLAFTNLIENGVKYNHENGWVRVTLKFDHKFFYVTVADSGMGIPEEQLERVFERFYRGDQSHSTTIEGTGLGLAITKDIVALHRGTVKVESTVGEGSVFTVRIPLINDEAGKV